MYILHFSVSNTSHNNSSGKVDIPDASTQVFMNHGSAKAES